MNNSTLISVIVPAYNTEKYIGTCIDSLLAQTYINYEIIIINDGSTDHTLSILDKYRQHPNIRIFSQENAGLSAARNRGISVSNGDLICFIDSDDYVSSDYLTKLSTPFFQFPNIDIAVCGYQEIYQDYQANYPLKPQLLTGFQATKNLLLNQRDFDILAWNKLYKKSLFPEGDKVRWKDYCTPSAL